MARCEPPPPRTLADRSVDIHEPGGFTLPVHIRRRLRKPNQLRRLQIQSLGPGQCPRLELIHPALGLLTPDHLGVPASTRDTAGSGPRSNQRAPGAPQPASCPGLAIFLALVFFEVLQLGELALLQLARIEQARVRQIQKLALQ